MSEDQNRATPPRLAEVFTVDAVPGDLSFALPAPQRAGVQQGRPSGSLRSPGMGWRVRARAEAVGLVVAEVAGGGGDAHDQFRAGGPAAVIVGAGSVGPVPAAGAVVCAGWGRAGRGAGRPGWPAPGNLAR
jgi:hypothetical protein